MDISSGRPSPAANWACPACTYASNEPETVACDVCGVVRAGQIDEDARRASVVLFREESPPTRASSGSEAASADRNAIVLEDDESDGDKTVPFDVCNICGASTVETDGSPMLNVLFCDGCNAEIHYTCSGLNIFPTGETWFCGDQWTQCHRSRKRARESPVDLTRESIPSLCS